MEQPPRRTTPRSAPRGKSAAASTSKAPRSLSGSPLRPGYTYRAVSGSTSRTPRLTGAYTSRAYAGASSSRSAGGPSSGLIRQAVPVPHEEHEVEVVYTGLPCTCKNCGITFGSYHDYYCHLVYAAIHQAPPLDLTLKLATTCQLPKVDLELRLRPADQSQ
ncbi:hypothetical protein DCAR_0313639 [Daucus carota subsp. sativus]|uniref:Uncharacterized protein n=1 Tax=Daucus carota subsp. sativus TaxID=79200 RepID=A0A169WEB9_DAUCS|nr:hypothetical protein DCAR_0313639 [Daucus carota subsp. sativus]